MIFDHVREMIREALAEAAAPVVACSFGKDSVLLLHLVREQCADVPVLWLRQDLLPDQRTFAERLIIEWDLTIYGVLPVDQYFVPAANGRLSLIREYGFHGESFPVVVDVVHGDRCALKLAQRKAPMPVEFPFDLVFTGFKESDSHPLLGCLAWPERATIGGAKVCAPLRNMTDEMIWQATLDLSLPYNQAKYDDHREQADPDCVVACTNCLDGPARVYCPDEQREILGFAWDREESRLAFQNRFLPVLQSR
jgi:3'-phosphoadenosine 5'-phosphosulfate sulfotransferase (PAPS reductase)/FAD synthetase